MSQLAGQQAAGAIPAALNSDPSLASSALQKAIRRGNVDMALRAAFVMLHVNLDRLWRRLVVIAMEDVGIGDLGLIIEVLEMSGRRAWRAQNGGDERLLTSIVSRLCQAPKSRDACDLLVVADLLPALAEVRANLFDADNDSLIARISKDGPLEDCTIAAWYLAGTDRFPAYSLPQRGGDFGLFLNKMTDLGASPQVIEAARLGSTRTREGFPVSLPLVALYAAPAPIKVRAEYPSSAGTISGWPSEAFDMHTHVGRTALRIYLQRCRPMQELLSDYMAPHKQADFLGHLVFRLEGAAVDRRVQFSGQQEIVALAEYAHLTYSRVAPEVIRPARALMLQTWDELHAARLLAAGAGK